MVLNYEKCENISQQFEIEKTRIKIGKKEKISKRLWEEQQMKEKIRKVSL